MYASALLVYGIDLGEHQMDEDEVDNLLLAKMAGFTEEHPGYHSPDYDGWLERYSTAKNSISGVHVESYGFEYEKSILCVGESGWACHGYTPSRVAPGGVPYKWNYDLKRALDVLSLYGVENTEPSWLLAVSFG
jgi:hypothetical protein